MPYIPAKITTLMVKPEATLARPISSMSTVTREFIAQSTQLQAPQLLDRLTSEAPQPVIPFHKPVTLGNEAIYMMQALTQGAIAGDGPFTKQCHQLLEQILGVQKALLTTSCTDALEMSALLLHIQPGDEVIVPSFTFVSTINAFVMRGAKPVFIDVRPDTLNLDETKLEAAITCRTKAIVPVHYAGVGCEMDAIMAIAQHHNIPVIEDNAHGLFARYKDQYLGTFGSMATQSFHQTKNFSCGEGGALLINDQQLLERAEIIREKGTNRHQFLLGQVDKYSWVDVGSSFLPSDLLAAMLYAQLEVRSQIQTRRQQIWEIYNFQLQSWANRNEVQLPTIPAHCEQAYHLFYVLMPTATARQNLMAYLKAQGIETTFHYLPLHLSDMGRQFGGEPGDCPVTEYVSERLVRLPLYGSLTDAEVKRIVNTIQDFAV